MKIEIDTQNKKDIMEYKLPNLTLQPIVENCVCHGLKNSSEYKPLILIKAYQTTHYFFIIVKDNGCGIKVDKLLELNKLFSKGSTISIQNNENSIGLKNINLRIKALYGDSYGLHIKSIYNVGTEVQIILPLKESVLNEN